MSAVKKRRDACQSYRRREMETENPCAFDLVISISYRGPILQKPAVKSPHTLGVPAPAAVAVIATEVLVKFSVGSNGRLPPGTRPGWGS